MTRAPKKAADPFEDIAASIPSFDEADQDQVTLRQMAMRDPIRGAPLIYRERPGDEPRDIEPGTWRGEGYGCRKTGLPPLCPIVPLGSSGDQFFFLNTLGQVHVMTASSFGKGPIEALFQGRTSYLEWAWPRWRMPKSKAEVRHVVGYEADECRMDLINACAFKGTFQMEDRVRGRGAWRGDDGALIFHAGDAIWFDRAWHAPGEHGRFIYPARPKIGRPAAKAAEVGEGAPGWMLFEAIKSWNWSRGELDARLALGWAMTGMVGGALSQRPVAFVPGPEGAGKSLLQNLFRALYQGGAVTTANTTPAAIYQKLGQDSLPVLSDEMEAKEDTRNTDRIIELARVSFSGDTLDRGGKEGQATSYRLMSSFFFSCITAPPIDAQDASRRVALDVRPRVAGAPNVLKACGFVVDGDLIDAKAVGAIGAALLKRWIDRWSLWEPLRAEIHADLRAWGHTARSADAFAPLVAASHLALSDDAQLTVEDRAMWQTWLTADVLTETSEREETWRRCFWHLLNKPTELLRESNIVTSIGAILNVWRLEGEKHPDTEPVTLKEEAAVVARKLERAGVSLSFPKGCDNAFRFARLWVPAKHPALHALFEGTAWAGRQGQPGPWHGVLSQAPEHIVTKTTSRLGLETNARGLMIDLAAALGDPRDDAEHEGS